MKNIPGKEKAIVIDVRDEWEYQEGHINGAVNIPLHEIPASISKLKKLEGPLILYCRSGNRSATALNILKQAGINNAVNGGSLPDAQRIIFN